MSGGSRATPFSRVSAHSPVAGWEWGRLRSGRVKINNLTHAARIISIFGLANFASLQGVRRRPSAPCTAAGYGGGGGGGDAPNKSRLLGGLPFDHFNSRALGLDFYYFRERCDLTRIVVIRFIGTCRGEGW